MYTGFMQKYSWKGKIGHVLRIQYNLNEVAKDQCQVEGPWIFGPIDFLKIAKTENTFPLQFLMTVELGNRRTTSFK